MSRLAYSRAGLFALTSAAIPDGLVEGAIDDRRRLVRTVRIGITFGHDYPDAELCDYSMAVNDSGDVFIAWGFDSNYGAQNECSADHTGVALLRAGSRRALVREIGPHDFRTLDTAINRRGVGVALFDRGTAVRMRRDGAVRLQQVEDPGDPGFDTISPLAVDPQGRFRFTALRIRGDGANAVVTTATADAHGRFQRPRTDLRIAGRVDAVGGGAVATNSRGDEVVAWPADSVTEPAPLWLMLRRHGRWIQRRQIKPGSDSQIAAAVGEDGTAVIAFARPNNRDDADRLAVALARPGDRFGPLRALGSALPDAPAAVVKRDGTSVVAWEPAQGHFHSVAAVAFPGSAFGAPAKLASCIYPDLRLDGFDHPVATLNCNTSRGQFIALRRLG